MKYVISKGFGGFRLPEEYLNLLDCPTNDCYEDADAIRTDPKLVAIVEAQPWESLGVVDVPDDATDTYIWEYDGWETLLYVQNGKIHKAVKE